MVIWIIGLAGAGKSTIAAALRERLLRAGTATVILDGENLRQIVGDSLGYSDQDRMIVATRLMRASRFLEEQDIMVICPVSGLFAPIRQENRRTYDEYFEVLLDVPLDEIIERDQRSLYSKALRGEIEDVVGIDRPFEPPAGCDLILFNGRPLRPPSELAQIIFEAL